MHTLYIINNFAHRLAVEPDERDGFAELDRHADAGHQQVRRRQVHQEYVGYTETKSLYFYLKKTG